MESKELQRHRLCFYHLLSEHRIPPKMQIKLRYLQAAILGTKLQTQHLNQLPEIERSSLLQMPIDTKTTLYCNILRCLSGEEVITYFTAQKAILRRQQFFSGWTSCYLDCDSNLLAVLKKIDKKQCWHQFLIQKLWISKVYRLYKKKYIFGISYEKVKYQIGFEEESSCQKVHGTIIDLIREKKAKRNKLKQSMSFSASVDGSQIQELEFQKDEIVIEHEFNEADYFQYQEWEYLSNLQKKVKEIDFTDECEYQLIKNIKKGKIMQNRQLNSLKICMLIEKCSIDGLIQSYVQLSAWNSQVETFTVLNRIRNNTFLAYLKLKKHSVFAYPRDAYVTITYMKTCQCLNNYENEIPQPESIQCNNNEYRKHYLVINSFEDNTYEGNSGAVRMALNQIIELSEVQDSESTVFMILLSKIDFKGYQYLSNNLSMNVNFMNDVESLPKYSIQRELVGRNNYIFNFNYCLCFRKKSRKRSAESQASMESNLSEEIPQEIEDDKNISPSFSKEPGRSSFEVSAFQVEKQIFNKESIVKIITDSLNSTRNQKMIELIKSKSFESYYLKHRFSEEVHDAIFKENNYNYGIIKDFLFQDGLWKIDHQQLVFCNQEILKVQKSILKMILKQMGSNLVSGKSIMNMSLPVEIFDRRSMLQVLASMMGFFPKYINDAVNTANPVEQIKFVTLSYMFINACLPNLEKPFNPILGETFQGTIGGIPIYLEQISHHPAIASLYIKTKDFQTYGNFDMHVDLGLNSAYSKLSSLFTVKIFKTKTEYSIKLPDVELGGVMFGERTMRLVGKGFVYEKTNDMYCEYSLGKQKKKVYDYNMKIKPTDIVGGIFKVSNSFGKKILMNYGKSFDGVKFDDIIQKYSQLSGRWYGDLYFDNTAYKTIDKGPFPVKLERSPYLLPSDSIFREDLIYKSWNQIQQSNRQKQVLENQQRRDKKQRQEFKKHRHQRY